jgi:hypothetical protein
VLLQDHYDSVHTNCSLALEALEFGLSIENLQISGSFKKKLKSNNPIEFAQIIKDRLLKVASGMKSVDEFTTEINRFGSFNLKQSLGFDHEGPEAGLLRFTEALNSYFEESYLHAEDLVPWSLYVARRKEAQELGLSVYVDLLESRQVNCSELSDAYGYCVHGTIIREAFRNIPQLGRFSGLKHNQIRDEFKRLDKEIISLRGKAIGFESARTAAPPYGQNGAKVDDRTEMVLLKYLLPQQRPRMPVRKILTKAGASIQELKPCFMMGPQAVAQYLTPGAIKFDLVIMDEASQLKPEEAIGAIARGGQLVVVGDPKQLPPTSFFSKMSQKAKRH